MERELLIQTPVTILPALDERWLHRARTILEPEFISRGGNIRDITVAQLQDFTTNGGQVWTARQGDACLAVTTIQPMVGLHPWLYINNGVAAPQERHRGIMDQLLLHAITTNGWNERYFVISVVTGVFVRCGFEEVVPDTLDGIDPIIANIVRSKLRPGKEAHVFILVPTLETYA